MSRFASTITFVLLICSSLFYAFTSEHLAGTVNHPEDLAEQAGTSFVVSVPDLSPPNNAGGSFGPWHRGGLFRG